ncbi:MAG: hypothetical protein NVSMB51_19650 [Solirubrobacteraceae bacterium]
MLRFRRRRAAPRPPSRVAVHGGLAYALFEPHPAPIGGVVVLHGAGSRKESHYDFARAACSYGLAAICFDARGHGDSEGRFGDGAIDDIELIAGLLPPGPRALRGSSMGGYLALLAAPRIGACAVVAICPAGERALLRGLAAGSLGFESDADDCERFLRAHPAIAAAERLTAPLLLLHAEGDEQVPVEHSRALLAAAGSAQKRLIAPSGGHHRSIQHDAEMQGISLQFLRRALSR